MTEQQKLPISILGVGSCVPKGRLTNDDLSEMVNTSDDWIISRTGIIERSISSPEENVYVMTALAAERALQDANLSPEDIDAIFVGTNGTGEFIVPGDSQITQYLIGATKSSACDINAGCSGGIYAAEAGIGKIMLNLAKRKGSLNVLALAGDTLSAVVNYKDRNTCVLLGDAAGGMVLGVPENGEGGIYSILTRAQGELGHTITYKSMFELPTREQTNGFTKLSHKESRRRQSLAFRMAGQPVFKFAVRALDRIVRECAADAGFVYEKIKEKLIAVPHQANLVILEKAAARLGLSMDQVCHWGIEHIGNSSAASVFVELDHIYRSGELERGYLIQMATFGAGLTYGGLLTEWQKDKYTGAAYSEDQQKQELAAYNEKYEKWKGKID